MSKAPSIHGYYAGVRKIIEIIDARRLASRIKIYFVEKKKKKHFQLIIVKLPIKTVVVLTRGDWNSCPGNPGASFRFFVRLDGIYHRYQRSSGQSNTYGKPNYNEINHFSKITNIMRFILGSRFSISAQSYGNIEQSFSELLPEEKYIAKVEQVIKEVISGVFTNFHFVFFEGGRGIIIKSVYKSV